MSKKNIIKCSDADHTQSAIVGESFDLHVRRVSNLTTIRIESGSNQFVIIQKHDSEIVIKAVDER